MLRRILSGETLPPNQPEDRQGGLTVQVYPEVLQEDCSTRSNPSVVAAIDQGTSSTRFVVFTPRGRLAAVAQMEHTQYFPPDHPGWHEHDPLEIWANVQQLLRAAIDGLEEQVVSKSSLVRPRLAAIGITNQRETTLAWNKVTGQCYYRAIVWDDTRTSAIAHQLAHGNADRLRSQTGLPLASYFAGTKVKWLLDNVETLRRDLNDPTTAAHVCFGTIDSWLLYQLTGSSPPPGGSYDASSTTVGNTGGLHCTDVTNASRWLFLNLNSCQWDAALVDQVCAPHRLPLSALPTICPSSHVYGRIHKDCGVNHPWFDDVPIASILGDQQAALFGQTAFEPGEAKNTYGTGLFLMMNTGTRAIASRHGLLTTVAYQLGTDKPVHFALEGSVSHAGSTIQWLRDQLQIIETASDTEVLATPHNDGLYFVPAFAGLFAPHWRFDARACIVGMTAAHHRGHICRAALEAAAYQTREVFDAIVADSSVDLKTLNVDGGMTHNQTLMQFQADVLQVKVVKPLVMETTSIGAAFAAGLAVGVWSDLEEIKTLWGVAQVWEPMMAPEERAKNWAGWKKAVTRSWDWVEAELEDDEDAEKFEDALDSISIIDSQAGEGRSGGSTQTWGRYCLSLLVVAGSAAYLGFMVGRSSLRK